MGRAWWPATARDLDLDLRRRCDTASMMRVDNVAGMRLTGWVGVSVNDVEQLQAVYRRRVEQKTKRGGKRASRRGNARLCGSDQREWKLPSR